MTSVSVLFCCSVALHGVRWARAMNSTIIARVIDDLYTHLAAVRIRYGFWFVFLTLF